MITGENLYEVHGLNPTTGQWLFLGKKMMTDGEVSKTSDGIRAAFYNGRNYSLTIVQEDGDVCTVDAQKFSAMLLKKGGGK